MSGSRAPSNVRRRDRTEAADSTDPRKTETLRLVEADEKATIDLISRLIAGQTAIRATVVPIASGLAGLALTNESPALALVAIPIVVLGIGIDTRSEYLQQQAHQRSVYLERIVQANLTALAEVGRPQEQESASALQHALDGYVFGTSRSLRQANRGLLIRSGVRQLSTYLYLFLIILLILAAIFARQSKPQPTSACVKSESGAIVQIQGDGVKISGEVTLVVCPPT